MADRVGDLLDGVLRRLGLTEEIARREALIRWEAVVGERVARVSRATAVSGDVLFVEVDSSPWLNELNLMRRELLSRLNAGRREGRIERIVFTLAEHRGGTPPVRRPDGRE